MQPTELRRLVDDLNDRYETLHVAKEDAFWASYMGLTGNADKARTELDTREVELQRFLRDPERLTAVRAALAAAKAPAGKEKPDPEDVVALEGWEKTLSAHAIDSAPARALAEEVVAAEGALARKRGGMKLGYEDPKKGFVQASSVKLGVMLRSEADAGLRKAAWQGLRSIERFALENGFLDLVRQRNRLGREQGAEDFYDWRVRRVEGQTKREIFALLDDLEVRTRDAARRGVEELKRRAPEPVTPWSVRWLVAGDVTKALDPHLTFAESVRRWGRSFAALGVKYRGAEMVLDLLDRKGKYENGFMHGPEVAWRRRGAHRRARIHFTANAIPTLSGSGQSATATLFHEGGHAAHFANVDMPAPCFGQEFAPTSVAFAETQSMFMDSLLEDADWLQRYALDAKGDPPPWAVIEQSVRSKQPFHAWDLRQMLSVCYGERAIYELPESKLTPDGVLEALRDVERRLLFLEEGSPRPVLSVPHLLSGESSAYYHGYVIAEMGVAQTRHHFLSRDGHLTDNPRIGPELAKAYWQPGNSRPGPSMVAALTGVPLGAAALAGEANRTVEVALREAEACRDRGKTVPRHQGKVDLDARIKVVHGNETVATLEPGGDFERFADQFAGWVGNLKSS